MQTMKQTWKKSLAALALLTALSPDGDRATAQAESGQSISASEVAVDDAPPVVNLGQPGEPVAIQVAPVSDVTRVYVTSRSGPAPAKFGDTMAYAEGANMTPEQQAVEQRLQDIRLDSIKYDGLPLGEVVNNLIELSAKQGRKGVNFVLNRETPSATGQSIDPATGLPVPDNTDLNSVAVHINPPLKNVRMIDVLDAISKTADHQIHFTIEDYGVLFSFGPKPKTEARQMMLQDRLSSIVRKAADDKLAPVSGRAPTARDLAGASAALEVMTFKLDTNTFFSNLEHTFQQKVAEHGSTEVKDAMVTVFEKSFGIVLHGQPGKSLFYNDANGMMMVRATPEDVATIRGVMEMLGATPYGASAPVQYQQRLQRLDSGARVNGGFGASAGSTTAGGGGGGKPLESR